MATTSSNSRETANWYAVHVKSREEERAAKNLLAWGIDVLAPRRLIPRQKSRFASFFPGYVFAKFDADRVLHDICYTRGVRNVVSFGGKPTSIAAEVIAEIRNRMDRDGFVTCDEPLRPGDLVSVRSGPLQSFTGVFERDLSGEQRVRILLDTVAYTARVELSRAEIVKCETTPDRLT